MVLGQFKIDYFFRLILSFFKLITKEIMSDIKIAVVGLGYVGLPLARLFATKYPVIGFDINARENPRIAVRN